MNTGDLIVIQDGKKFRESVLSFQDKWEMGTATLATATVTATVMATVMATATWVTATATAMATVTEKQTKKKIKIKYYGHFWKELPEQFVGIVTEIISEDHPDFDVIKIREQTGGVRYCRRFVLENALD